MFESNRSLDEGCMRVKVALVIQIHSAAHSGQKLVMKEKKNDVVIIRNFFHTASYK